jgi:hypothetical protein
VIVEEVDEATAEVVTRKETEDAPGFTVAVEGALAGPVAKIVITAPPAGAGPFNVTVAVEELPPTTAVGFRTRLVTESGLIVSVAVFVTPKQDAVIVDVVDDVTVLVVALKVAEVAPAAMKTVDGTVAPVVAVRFTITPPVGAALASLTVPTEVLPPITVVGERVRLERTGVV